MFLDFKLKPDTESTCGSLR